MLITCQSASVKGFTLIELALGLGILATLMLIALPSYRPWIQAAQIRNAATSIQNGLQLAKAEAIRRNSKVQLLFTDSEPVVANINSAQPSAKGRNWIVRVYRASGGYTAADFVQGRAGSEGSNNAIVMASRGDIVFLPSGRVDPGIANDVTITNPSGGRCVTAGGNMRCLQVVVSSGGRIRMCDPALSLASNPQGCA